MVVLNQQWALECDVIVSACGRGTKEAGDVFPVTTQVLGHPHEAILMPTDTDRPDDDREMDLLP